MSAGSYRRSIQGAEEALAGRIKPTAKAKHQQAKPKMPRTTTHVRTPRKGSLDDPEPEPEPEPELDAEDAAKAAQEQRVSSFAAADLAELFKTPSRAVEQEELERWRQEELARYFSWQHDYQDDQDESQYAYVSTLHPAVLLLPR